jgi:hypothetical protein
MKYTFTLEENDYLTNQLFVFSTSKPAIRRRRKSWLMTTLAFAVLSYLMEQSNNEFLRNYFIGIAILSLVMFPFYSRWRYKKHFKKHVNEHYAKSYGKQASLEFQKDHVLTQDEFDSESRINHSQIESVNELPNQFLIRLGNGQSLILPKRKTEQIDKLRADLIDLGNKVGHELSDNTSWKWK